MSIDKRYAALCGLGAFLLFIDQFFEGTFEYLLSGTGIVMVILGLVMLFRSRKPST